MVMRRNMMRKNLSRSILRSLGRYIAIVAIIALGASIFVGLLMTKSDMVATGQVYTDAQNMFDLRLVSSYGWDPEQVEQVAALEGIVEAEGLIYQDLIVFRGESADEQVCRFYQIPERVNQIRLLGGRMPEGPDECLADGYHADDSILGTQVTVSPSNADDALETLNCQSFTVVGYVSTPLYMDMNRGTTTVGSGSLASYYYVPMDAFDVDYYTEINVTLEGNYAIYSDRYNDAMDAAAERLEPLVLPFAQQRLDKIRAEAEKSYRDGLKEYEDGLDEFREGKEKAEQELQDAYDALIEAEALIEENEKKLANGEQQLAAARLQLIEGEKTLKESREQYETLKGAAYLPIESAEAALDASYASLAPQIQSLEGQLAELNGELDTLNGEIAAAEAEFADITAQIETLDGQINSLNAGITGLQAALSAAQLFPGINEELVVQLEAAIADQTAQRDALTAQRGELEAQQAPYLEQLEAPYARREELQSQVNELSVQKRLLDFAMDAVETGKQEIQASRAALDAQFADTEAQLRDGEAQLAAGWAQVWSNEAMITSGKQELEDGKKELEEGWKEYYEGKTKAETELADAEAELAEAKDLLEEAREAIDAMEAVNVYVLDRNTNVGYISLDSASDIVAGVSRVFPAFFLLVAALVCITTMTRMIDEERTQIGTLKALGYSNGAIIAKYLVYAGSGAVVGCGLGVFAGSVVFPKILWEAYKIMLFIQDDIVLTINFGLCGAVVLAYTAVMLFVTWYCCRRTLQEEPAELIRPKAPDPGKKLLIERLPFWKKISFLNKVTIRNIFRYRQRLAMMMVGIGGCTALLLTGYGLRDSIVNVVDYQFEEVTVYDLSVYFKSGITDEDRAEFQAETAGQTDATMFYHQSSIELDFDNKVREIYFIAAGEGIETFIDFHKGEEALSLPGTNEVMLSSGVAEAMGVEVGDQILLRNAEMQTLNLTVSAVYDNHVYNYAIVTPATVAAQWGAEPEEQMAFVKVREGTDAHGLSAQIAGLPSVMNVSVSEDLADMVANMMEALDLVVWVIVFCAGLLAVTVLYNLTNINITERIREIATIKVLGFNAKETGAYVFKENMSLTVIGSVFGLGLGYLLLLFVMSQVKIDMVWFKALAKPLSYGLAIALTILAAVFVDFVFYFKLDKINMAEALKSVE